MGAPKQKWTADEEAALRAGIVKHGAGKWRTILKDPEFSGILSQRSNVDLKDKWRNMSLMAYGLGSRGKARLMAKSAEAPKQESSSIAMNTVVQIDEEKVDVKPQGSSAPTRSIARLDDVVLEAITNLNEPGGSKKSSIAEYIKDQFQTPPDFIKILSAKLKFLTIRRRLIKVNGKYKVEAVPNKRGDSSALVGRQMSPPRVKIDEVRRFSTRDEVLEDLDKMRSMNAQEAAETAHLALLEAEHAIAEAEQAVKDAEEAEAEAEADTEAAIACMEAAIKGINGRSTLKMVKNHISRDN